MALILCPDCNKNVSSNASSCPHCGRLIAKRESEKDPWAQPPGTVEVYELTHVEPGSAAAKAIAELPSQQPKKPGMFERMWQARKKRRQERHKK